MATNTRKLAALLGASGANIADAGTINTAGITADAIDNTKIADNAVNADSIAANAVGTSEVADNVLTATDLAANSVGESELSVDYTAQSVPHIIPGVLQPAVAGKLLNGANHSGAYGTAQTQSGGDGHSYYYTDIKGSKPIKDPRIGAHFGSQRHRISSVQLLEQETATHGKDVFSIDGRDWLRVVGGTISANDGRGSHIVFKNGSNAPAGDFLEITGYFNKLNYLAFNEAGRMGLNYQVNGGSATQTNDTQFTTAITSPLDGRYVNPMAVHTINIGTITEPGIYTVKLVPNTTTAAAHHQVTGIELIAQDLSGSGSPNRSKIKFPAQNVVSYGKKFAIAETNQHYDPFNGFTNDSTLFSSVVDTSTSLGLGTGTTYGAPWDKGSNNHIRPFNGGRVVKWVDSAGTIKTSVTMMPANAQNWRTLASNEITTASATNSHPINFSDDAVENSLTEVAKTYHVREFGNGSANGSSTFKDISTMTTGDSNRAFVMDDGLTTLTVKHGKWDNAIRSGASDVELNLYVTFIGTGFSCFYYADNAYNSDIFVDGVKVEDSSPSSTNRKIEVQNLPYGTHIISFIEVQDTNDNPLVFIGDGSFTIFQPKKPPIPEDAVVLADYMLMADFVQQTTGTVGHISKGARFQSHTRDLFYKAAATINFGQQTNSASGYQANIAHDDNTQEVSITAFAKNATFKMHDAPARVRTYKQNGTTVATTKVGTSYDSIAYASDTTLQNQKFEMGGAKVGSSTNAPHYFGIEVATPIHTSSHYQTFETPFLKELVGGDRNMEQHNLVCSPDGKTWDEVTRDTSYISSKSKVQMAKADQDIGGTVTKLYYTYCRGTANTYLPAFNKDFALAYDEFICLKTGTYKLIIQGQTSSGGSYMELNIVVNGVTQAIREQDGESGGRGSSSLELSIHLKRGDAVSFKANNMEASHGSYWAWVQIDEI